MFRTFVYEKQHTNGVGIMVKFTSIQKSRQRQQDFAKNDRSTAVRARNTRKCPRQATWLTFEELESLVVSTKFQTKDVARILNVSTNVVRRSAEIYSVIYNGQPVNMYDLLRSRQPRGRKSKTETIQ
jgi:DNA-binding transcriptional regulator YiaG